MEPERPPYRPNCPLILVDLSSIRTLRKQRRSGVARLGVRARSGADFRQLLIDCEEDRTLPAVLVGMLRESEGR